LWTLRTRPRKLSICTSLQGGAIETAHIEDILLSVLRLWKGDGCMTPVRTWCAHLAHLRCFPVMCLEASCGKAGALCMVFGLRIPLVQYMGQWLGSKLLNKNFWSFSAGRPSADRQCILESMAPAGAKEKRQDVGKARDHSARSATSSSSSGCFGFFGGGWSWPRQSGDPLRQGRIPLCSLA
jgi:hypothetical protein